MITIEIRKKVDTSDNVTNIKYESFVELHALLEWLEGEYDVEGFGERLDPQSRELVVSAYVHKHRYSRQSLNTKEECNERP